MQLMDRAGAGLLQRVRRSFSAKHTSGRSSDLPAFFAGNSRNRPGVRAVPSRIEGGYDKEELQSDRGGVGRSPFDGISITAKCVKNTLSV